MAVVLVRFLSLPDTLRPFTAPLAAVFALFGWFRPSLGLYPIIFALPMVPMGPFVQGVANFSLVEIAWWSHAIGRLARRSLAPRLVRTPPPPHWPALVLVTLALCGSSAVRLARNFVWLDPVVWPNLWGALGDFFRMPQDSPFHALRAAVIWLEGLAFLTLLRRNAPRALFQRRVRALLMLSLALVVLTSLHQFTLSLVLGPETLEILAPWQVAPDWLPDTLTARLPGLRAVHGLWPDVNSFASYLLMIFPLVLSLFVLGRDLFTRALLLVLGALTLLALVLTFSRIAWVWFPLVVAVWVLLSRRRAQAFVAWLDAGGRHRLRVALLLGLAALGATLLNPGLHQRALGLFDTPAADRLNLVLKGRLNLWEKALRVAHDDPLFGCGLGSFFDRSGYHHRPAKDTTAAGAGLWNPLRENAHNQFLQILAETGLLGLGLVLWLMGQWAAGTLRTLAWGRGGDRWMARGLLTSVFALSGSLLTGHALLLIEMLLFFWTIVGLAAVRPAGPAPSRRDPRPPPWTWRTRLAGGAIVAITAGRLWAARDAPDLLPIGVGLYPPEQEQRSGLEFQWTTDRAVFVLRNMTGECGFHLSNARPDLRPVPVEVLIEGELRARLVPPDYHWWPHRLAVDLPPGAIYHLELRALETFGSEERRPDLGIRVRGITF